jgi:hypothetical protein
MELRQLFPCRAAGKIMSHTQIVILVSQAGMVQMLLLNSQAWVVAQQLIIHIGKVGLMNSEFIPGP